MLPLLREVKGELTLSIYGPEKDAEYLEKCQRLAAGLPSRVRVDFLGPVSPIAMTEKLAPHHFSILPTMGENFGHSIFEGLLAGKPVIISDRTPWKHLKEKEIGWDCSLEKPEAFVQALQAAVDMDQQIYDHWSHSAWQFAADYKSQPEWIEATRSLFLQPTTTFTSR